MRKRALLVAADLALVFVVVTLGAAGAQRWGDGYAREAIFGTVLLQSVVVGFHLGIVRPALTARLIDGQLRLADGTLTRATFVPWRRRWVLALALFFGSVAVAGAVAAFSPGPRPSGWFGLALVVTCAAVSVRFVAAAFRPRPTELALTPLGLLTPGWTQVLVPWHAMTLVRRSEYLDAWNRSLLISLDPAVVPPLGLWRRRTLTIFWPTLILGADGDRFEMLLRRYRTDRPARTAIGR